MRENDRLNCGFTAEKFENPWKVKDYSSPERIIEQKGNRKDGNKSRVVDFPGIQFRLSSDNDDRDTNIYSTISHPLDMVAAA